jgi:hypothetical protein
VKTYFRIKLLICAASVLHKDFIKRQDAVLFESQGTVSQRFCAELA